MRWSVEMRSTMVQYRRFNIGKLGLRRQSRTAREVPILCASDARQSGSTLTVDILVAPPGRPRGSCMGSRKLEKVAVKDRVDDRGRGRRS